MRSRRLRRRTGLVAAASGDPQARRSGSPGRPLRLAACGALAALAAAAAAHEGPVTFEFSFSNPGAGSMALGGAFAAIADDATAAFANPAGLVQLVEPEISLEGRATSLETPFVAGGRASGEPRPSAIRRGARGRPARAEAAAPASARDEAPAVPEALSEVIGRCLASDPAERFQAASELRQALGRVAVEA